MTVIRPEHETWSRGRPARECAAVLPEGKAAQKPVRSGGTPSEEAGKVAHVTPLGLFARDWDWRRRHFQLLLAAISWGPPIQ